jgi:3-hydroxymyristoyl/3-hydroxydecanoyl-(acyl carrier protein) dehydratase
MSSHLDCDGSRFEKLVVAAGVVRAVVRRSHADELCAGHFPGEPLVPGAYLAGLMADVARVLVAATSERGTLAAIEECAFLRRVVPHEPIAIEARLASGEPGSSRVDAEVHAAGVRAARARLRFEARA